MLVRPPRVKQRRLTAQVTPPVLVRVHRRFRRVVRAASIRMALISSSVSTQWGNVQVKVTISGGKITDVTMVHSTSEDGEGRSQAIDNQAEPVYISETKKAQSADIQAISGATVTYEGYTQSLQSALDKAV